MTQRHVTRPHGASKKKTSHSTKGAVKPPIFTPPRAGFVVFSSNQLGLSVTVRMDSTNPDVIEGIAGTWNEVPRPHRRSITTFAGWPALKRTIGVFFNGHNKLQADGSWGQSVEPDIQTFEAICGEAGPSHEPCPIELTGAIDYSGASWVCVGIDWGDRIVNVKTGERERQHAVIHLMEYTTQATTTGNAVTKTQTASAKFTRYTVRKGDTLQSIAHRFLGDAKKWTLIAAANKIRDPKSIKPGQTLRIPKESR